MPGPPVKSEHPDRRIPRKAWNHNPLRPSAFLITSPLARHLAVTLVGGPSREGSNMKSLVTLVSSVSILVLTTPAQAQTPTPAIAQPAAPSVMTIAPATPGLSVLPQGTPIRLRLMQQLHSQENRTGDRFDLEVAEDVMLNGVVIIPRGSRGIGEITRIRRKGMWGRSGRLETRLLSVTANGMTVPISGGVAERGDTGTAGVVASVVVLPIAGFFVTGTSAILPVGTGFDGHTNSEIRVAIDPSLIPRAMPAPTPAVATTNPR